MNEENNLLAGLESAFEEFDAAQEKESNPQHSELVEIRTSFKEGFEGDVLADKLYGILSRFFADKKLKHKIVVFQDDQTSITSQKQLTHLQNTLPNGREITYKTVRVADASIDWTPSGMTEHGFLLWEKVLPILPTGEEMDKFIELLKNDPEATKLILELFNLEGDELIKEVASKAAEEIRKYT
ncbi:MAG: hypothetical protein COU63_03870 [Candidatus Pacebacteria bacterium CG10_big_fil_rev_8_21_14_0_10_36_11]|nr:hypothetical protein [Candidatus Pacearchaeota archaeon]OIP74138.1 MAG: hypothetical protein AUK08_02705 [Candidatus Pacebacteria bacterium CG2_30_36_39]PIR64508.1 MAG: hypothetical protein COU63_03870 [Candidatus Pacebacteria bacterium CG10_big_fil_rev_8_21_14_0_10_36_11]PJC43201.1 MAG: hypothetical protein CO040_00420 [Candidatus Pacebacteria bacterium CG_4_9_14_0_2_um_filter_36_8]